MSKRVENPENCEEGVQKQPESIFYTCECGQKYNLEDIDMENFAAGNDDNLVLCPKCTHNISGYRPHRLVFPHVAGSKVIIGVTYTEKNGKQHHVRVNFLSRTSDGVVPERVFTRMKKRLIQKCNAWEKNWEKKGYKATIVRPKE